MRRREFIRLIGTVAGAACSGAAIGRQPMLAERVDDGSANAPAGLPQLPSVLKGYAARPPWQVAGVDYHVGPDAGVPLIDGSVQRNLPSGVEVSGGQVAVNAVAGSSVTVDGFDFTMLTGTNVFSVTGTGTINIRNCKFKVPDSFHRGDQFFIRCDSAASILFEKCEFDGNGAVTGPAGWNNPLFFMNGACKQTYRYLYVHNIPFDGIYPARSLDDAILQAPLIEFSLFAYCNYAAAAHFDTVQVYGGGSGPIVRFNTMYQPVTDQNGLPLGPPNSFYRIGDQGNHSPLSVSSPEAGFNTICGAGRYLSIIQFTEVNPPKGYITSPWVHDNYIDVRNIQNFCFYPKEAHISGEIYANNISLNTGSVLPRFFAGRQKL